MGLTHPPRKPIPFAIRQTHTLPASQRATDPPLKKQDPAAFPFMNTASHHHKLAEPTAPDNAHYPEVHPNQ
jgi:hypothetical protein